jgi:hypothetical protein
MKPLSEQLTELSARAKQAEDFVDEARSKNRAFLDSQRETLKSSIDDSTARVAAGAAAAQDKAESWLAETRSAVEDRFASLRIEHDEHRAERDLNKAERHAADAEQPPCERQRLRAAVPAGTVPHAALGAMGDRGRVQIGSHRVHVFFAMQIRAHACPCCSPLLLS